ncbi:hypothetical protein [Bradyrhizobium sp. 613_E4_N2_2]|uniref:hypothetical protein n=1 Tax=Bradyrhizobium sp. 613_E4_N2_2 TaxID=3240371 RepID=UPI003F8A466C
MKPTTREYVNYIAGVIVGVAAMMCFTPAAKCETIDQATIDNYCGTATDIARTVIEARDNGISSTDIKVMMSLKKMDGYLWMVDGIYAGKGLPNWMQLGQVSGYCRDKLAAAK